MRFPYSTCIFLITTHRTKTPICSLFVKNPIVSSYYLEHKEHFSHSCISARIQGNVFASHVKCAQEVKVYFEFRLTNKPKKITTVTMGSEDCSVVEIRKG